MSTQRSEQSQNQQVLQQLNHFYIIQEAKFCDILCPCKKNSFAIKTIIQRDRANSINTIIEISNCCLNFYFCQYRSMQLVVGDYVGKRSLCVPYFSTPLMTIKKNDIEIGSIEVVPKEFDQNYKTYQIYSKPFFKINQNEPKLTFYIALDKDSIFNYEQRYFCCSYSELNFSIYEKKEDEQEAKNAGKIIKKYQGFKEEYCTRGDLFEINLQEQYSEDTKMLLIYGCLQLNYQEFEHTFNLP